MTKQEIKINLENAVNAVKEDGSRMKEINLERYNQVMDWIDDLATEMLNGLEEMYNDKFYGITDTKSFLEQYRMCKWVANFGDTGVKIYYAICQKVGV